MKRINDLLISRVQFCLKVCDFFFFNYRICLKLEV